MRVPPYSILPVTKTSGFFSLPLHWFTLLPHSIGYSEMGISVHLMKTLKFRPHWLETVLNEAPCKSLTKLFHKLQRSPLCLRAPLCFICTCLSDAADRRIASVYACVRCVCVCTSVCIHVEARVQPWVSFLRHHSPFFWHMSGTGLELTT